MVPEKDKHPHSQVSLEQAAGFLLEAMVVGSRQAVINSEKHGVEQLIAESGRLPLSGSSTEEYQALLEKLGFKLGPPCDELFREVTYPAGWKLVADEKDPRYMTFLDARGRRRLTVFYKAAFYDRKASLYMPPLTRFSVDREYGDRIDNQIRAFIRDRSTGEVIKVCPWRTLDEKVGNDYASSVDADECAWLLTQTLHDWKNPSAYWDDEPDLSVLKVPAV